MSAKKMKLRKVTFLNGRLHNDCLGCMPVAIVVALPAMVASGVASLDKTRNLRKNKKPQKKNWVGPKNSLKFHDIVASDIGRIVVSTVAKGSQ